MNMRTNQRLRLRYVQLAPAIAFFGIVLALWILPTPAHASGGFPIIGVLHAGSHPEGIAVDTQTHMVYIAYEYPSSVVGFDPSSGKVRWSAPVIDSVTDVHGVNVSMFRVQKMDAFTSSNWQHQPVGS